MRWGAQVEDAFLDHHHDSNLAAHAEQNKLLQLHMTFKEGCHPAWKNSEKVDRDNWLRMMVDERKTLTITEEMQAWLPTSTKVVANCICVHDNIQQSSAFFTDQMRQASLHGGLQQPSPSQSF